MTSFPDQYGPWALVTGASSGMGTEFARRLAEKGLNVVLLARREDRLRSLAVELERDYSVRTRVVAVDLTRDDLLDSIRDATDDIEVGLLVNNAGFATSGKVLDNDLSVELAMLHVNSRAPLVLSHHFGRRMREQGKGGIIFVASTVAYSGAPGWSNYAATKAFDLTLSGGIARELHGDGATRGAASEHRDPRLLDLLLPRRSQLGDSRLLRDALAPRVGRHGSQSLRNTT